MIDIKKCLIAHKLVITKLMN